MQLRSYLLLFSCIHIHILACQAAWVRKFRCGASQAYDGPFRIDSLRGKLNDNVLSLAILGVHNVSQFSCDNLNVTGFEGLRFHVLGYLVGHLVSFNHQCPLPITDTLTPPEGLLFSNYQLVYSFGHTHRLQTLATEISFPGKNGDTIDCAAVKITPDIGPAGAAGFTYVPAAVVAIVGLASWVKQLTQLGRKPLFEYSTSWNSQGPIWNIILDVESCLQYLQYIFLAGSLSVEYPGFYQPLVSQVSWSSLLYWTGPITHGFTYTGVEDGMYVSNASYGLEYMAQMLAYPQMPDIMLDAFINLLILVLALMVVLPIFWLALPTVGQLGLFIKKAVCMVLAGALWFFSLPLLSYMSYELILIGYLPNYRVTLVALVMVVIVYLNYLIARHFSGEVGRTDSVSTEEEDCPTVLTELMQSVSHYLPRAIPLIQGIIIGGLQDWGLVQLLVLGGCEVLLLLHLAIQFHTRVFVSKAAWCAIARLLTVLLSIVFACSFSEPLRQWVGYSILCLHGAVVIFVFLFISLWQLSRTLSRATNGAHGTSLDQSNPLSTVPAVGLDRLCPRRFDGDGVSQPSSNTTSERHDSRPGSSSISDRGFENNDTVTDHYCSAPATTDHYITDFSAFYRAPRPRANIKQESAKHSPALVDSASETSVESCADSNLGPSLQDSFDELLEEPSKPGVDYSVRESDLYYGRPESQSTQLTAPGQLGNLQEPQADHPTPSGWLWRAAAQLRPPQKKEKGFQVMRPPRPG
ncbi:hypothetical protein BDV23DRAFT_193075 [Aspergillus alliaceus]|uniref:TRP C-terminal domain-containing protein n=1 Tax=Petromyces alliaceus TaxID=209559 RepID=A0A5N7CDC9_PETAA|nr:hypothetical protein BDV23DRAFT_193075 [Aspergillus alliaceus]